MHCFRSRVLARSGGCGTVLFAVFGRGGLLVGPFRIGISGIVRSLLSRPFGIGGIGVILRPRVAGNVFRSIACRGYSCFAEGSGPRSCSHSGLTVVHRGELIAISARCFRVLSLRFGSSHMAIASCSLLLRVRTSIDSAGSSVVADPVHCNVIDDGSVVGVVNVHNVHVVDRAVVVKVAAVPISTFIAIAGVTESVIDATVETPTLVRSPISDVPDVGRAAPAPITWSPEVSHYGSNHPRARYPVVAVRTISPVTRSPDVARSRAQRL